MALPVLVGMAARCAGSKVVEQGIEKAGKKGWDALMSSEVLKGGLKALDKEGRLDVPSGPAKMLMSSVTEPPLKSLGKEVGPKLK